ncbi:MAG: hypothetical protein IPN69_17450 [Acidobacteria bacterium]|nr:hypothetical protein [Acidobacteriota bacterium]
MIKRYISMLVFSAVAAVVLPMSVEGQKLEVRLLAFDNFGRVLSGLKPENFRVKAGKDRPSITRLEFEENEPIAVAFVVNNRIFGEAEAYLAVNYIRKANPANDYCVISSNEKAEVVSAWKSDRSAIESQLQRIAGTEDKKSRSVVFDAASLAIEKLAESPLRKKVMMIFGTGYDISSKTKLSAVKEMLRNSDVTVFGIDITSRPEWTTPVRDENIDAMTELTGGVQRTIVLDSGLMFDMQKTTPGGTLPELPARQKPASLIGDPKQLLDESAQRLVLETKMTYRIELSSVSSPKKVDFEIELRDLKGKKLPIKARFRLLPN